jgi:hypothetical protein
MAPPQIGPKRVGNLFYDISCIETTTGTISSKTAPPTTCLSDIKELVLSGLYGQRGFCSFTSYCSTGLCTTKGTLRLSVDDSFSIRSNVPHSTRQHRSASSNTAFAESSFGGLRQNRMHRLLAVRRRNSPLQVLFFDCVFSTDAERPECATATARIRLSPLRPKSLTLPVGLKLRLSA